MKANLRGASRRAIIAAGASAVAFGARAQTHSASTGTPPSVITNPPRQ